MKRIDKFMIIPMALLLLLAVSCNSDVLTTPPQNYEGSSGRPFTKAFFTGNAPKDIVATQAFYTDKVSVVFDVVPGADYYEIYKAAVPRGMKDANVMSLDWKKLDYDVEPLRETDRYIIWEDEIPDAERLKYRYFYKVRAGSNVDYSNNVKEGSFSNVVEGWTLIPPTLLSVSQGEYADRITVNWVGDDLVQGYLVYLLDSATGKWNIINDDIFAAQPEGENIFSFDYTVDSANYGKTLYFRLGSVSLGSKPSEKGIIRSGYTFVKGAPAKPKNLTVSKAEYSDKIEVSWLKPSDDKRKPGYNWKVIRYTDDTPEVDALVFNAYEIIKPEKMPENLKIEKDPVSGKDMYVFTDTPETGVLPGVVYHYKVMAFAEMDVEGETMWIPGKAEIQDGSLFAPPVDISIDVSFPADAPDGRFTFKLPTPFGYKEGNEEESSKGWKYNLYGRFNNGLDTPEDYSLLVDDVEVAENETTINYDFCVMDKKNEFTVTLENPTEESKNTEVLYKVVLTADNVSIDDVTIMINSYKNGLTANGNGVYPVYLTVNNADAFKTLYVGIDGAEPIPVSMTELKNNGFVIKSPDKPFETYTYTLSAESHFGRKTKVSKPVVAYGTLTPEKFIKVFEAYVLKPWEFAEKSDFPAQLKAKWNPNSGTPAGNLHAKIDKRNTDSMGYAEVSSDFHDGLLIYDSKMSGFAGDVHFKYRNFGELEGIWGTGAYSMLGMGLDGSGKSVRGNVTVYGMYPANIEFGGLGVSSYVFTGNYKVKFSNELGDKFVGATSN